MKKPPVTPFGRFAAGYSFGPVTVDVETDTADAQIWLKEFLSPAAEVTPSGQGEIIVRARSSHAECDVLEASSESATTLIPCFSLDRKFVMLSGWTEGAATFVADPHNDCFYRFRERAFDVIGRPERPRARLGLMRVVRETLTARRLSGGPILDLHAAAFETGGRAVVIVGPKYSGKTASLCYALASGKARLIANDRVFVDVAHESIQIHGLPTLVSIRPDTIRFFPELKSGTALLLHSHERRAGDDIGKTAGEVLSFTPQQLARRLGATCLRAARLTTIVFSEISAETDSWNVAEISPAEGIALIDACRYGMHRDAATRTLVERLTASSRPSLDVSELTSRLTGRVRFFRCRLGPHAYEETAADWFQALGVDEAAAHA